MVVSDQYLAVALQLRCEAVNGDDEVTSRRRIMASITRVAAQVAASCQLLGDRLKLVVLPEYLLTGFPVGETPAQWTRIAALDPDGPEMSALAAIASDNDIFLSLNAYIADPEFAPLSFQTCLVIDPSGSTVLRYPRLISLYGPTPLDVWDAWIDRHGLNALVPVADTAIGRLAAIASEEILYPEIARLACMAGAEVLLHNSGEIGSPAPTPKEICRVARAAENSAYLVSANAAMLVSGAIPAAITDGMSKIIDYRGLILAEAGQGETLGAHAEIDLAALRRHRTRPGMSAMLSRIPAEAFASIYQSLPCRPLNGLLGPDGKVISPERSMFRSQQEATIARLVDAGRLRRP